MAGLMARRMMQAGRNGDTELGHLTRGEVVLPESVLNQGDTRSQVMEGFRGARRPFGRFEVGGRDDSINPTTGLREFYGDGPGDSPGDGGSDPSGDAGGQDGGAGPGDYGFSASQNQAATDAVGMADFGAGMNEGPVSQGFDVNQGRAAQAAMDAFGETGDRTVSRDAWNDATTAMAHGRASTKGMNLGQKALGLAYNTMLGNRMGSLGKLGDFMTDVYPRSGPQRGKRSRPRIGPRNGD